MGSSKPSLHSNDKEGMLRAFYDEWIDMQKTYHIVLEFIVEVTERKGVLRFTICALHPFDGLVRQKMAYYQCEYPTAQVQSLEAALFRCTVQLERILRDRSAYPQGKA